MSVVRDLIFLVFVLGGAVFGSQVPVFVDAYAQRLRDHGFTKVEVPAKGDRFEIT